MPVENLTDVEFKTYVEANPDVLEKVIAPVLTAKEYSLMSKSQKEKYDSDREHQVVSGFVSKHALEVENTVKELTGYEKVDANEKYFEYNKRALKTLKEERDALRDELAPLKGKSDLSKVERDQLEELRTKVKEYDKQLKESKDGFDKQLNQARLENEIVRLTNTVSPKLLKDERPGFKKAQEILHNSIFEEIKAFAQKDSRGEIILVGKDGKAITKDGLFVTVEQYYESKMNEAGFIDDGKQQAGAGGGGKDNIDVKNIPGGVKTKSELVTWLRANTMKGKTQTELLAEFDKYAHLLPNE